MNECKSIYVTHMCHFAAEDHILLNVFKTSLTIGVIKLVAPQQMLGDTGVLTEDFKMST